MELCKRKKVGMWRSYSIWDSVVIIAHGGEPCIEQGGEAMGGGVHYENL